MKYLLPLAVLLFISGCNDTPADSAPAAAKSLSSAAHSVPAVTEKAAASRPKTVTPQLVRKAENSPAVLFQKCAACHGSHAEKSALNQSAVISEWDAKRIISTIVGYQEGTYGGAMKTLMQNQVKDLSRNQIEALAEYIVSLNVKTH